MAVRNTNLSVAGEKTIPEQMQTLYDKWNPESPKCLFQKYFYNSVGGERVPFYGPGPDEDEQKWEDALAKKPDDGSVPVLCKGFASMAYRLRMQVESVQTLQARLHEINNSLDEQLRQHELNVSVRAMDARRRHVALSGRCLQLATKIQVLRNRGYVMDSAEEELKKQLDDLAKKAFDSSIISRQEGIWARMFGIRERARVLQKESEKAGVSLATQSDDGVDEEVLRRTKKVSAHAHWLYHLGMLTQIHRFSKITIHKYLTCAGKLKRSARIIKIGRPVVRIKNLPVNNKMRLQESVPHPIWRKPRGSETSAILLPISSMQTRRSSVLGGLTAELVRVWMQRN